MNPEYVHTQTRSKATFSKHHNENSLFIWWLYDFNDGSVINQYRMWHHGDELKSISPLKNLEKKDVDWNPPEKKRWVKNLDPKNFQGTQ